MKPYSSIESVYTRDKETKRLVVGDLRQPIHDLITEWVITEKVDGMNIRVIYQNGKKEIRGRTDKAQLNHRQLAGIDANTPTYEAVCEKFDLDFSRTVTLYGEGYGAGIQKKGSQYRDDIGFTLFDVRITNTLHDTDYFLSMNGILDVARGLDIEHVPVLGVITLGREYDEIDRARLTNIIPHSVVALRHKGHKVEAEGIVAKPKFELQDQYGNRIQWKLTYRDV